ncbi:MAG: UDP-4-amino-4,6-dideoxy-N-acetyl-beta-L-altrosamine transaminase [Gammaproteobacteria bacterium]|nr:UDP-4-amino-4,6-dideoxy-N-acetyl-beta-L-altrosamine transaminase [Gammaproteobacteria bacterium]
MKIKYGRQDITKDDISSVVDVLKSELLTQGPVVPKFEEAVCNFTSAKYGIAVNSATSALHIACMALDLGPGDMLWTSPNTFVASSNCAIYCGADVDFVDIDPLTYNMSVEKLEEKLVEAKQDNRLPKVLVPVHLSGQSCEMSKIKKLSIEYDFKIIEDASHSIGGNYMDIPVGGCKYSDITVFSFHPVKIITTGEGGMALTNDPDLANKMRQHRSHGITSNEEEMFDRPNNELWNYQQIRLGYNYRMTDIAASLGLSQLGRLQKIIHQRHKIAERYNNDLASLPIKLPWQHPDCFSSYHLYIIRLNLSDIKKSHPQIHDELCDIGILVNLHYIPVYRQPFYEKMGFKKGHCPESERYHEEALSIPMYPTLTESEQDIVIKTLKKVIN